VSAPAGPCEWCGGPQTWTLIRGDVYVNCESGCLPLPGLGLEPPPDSEELVRPTEESPKVEHVGGGGVEPLEGGEARTIDKLVERPEFPTRDFLDTLWEGGDGS